MIGLYGNPETYTQQLRALETTSGKREFGRGPFRPGLPLPDEGHT